MERTHPIRAYRVRNGLTLEAMAERIGASKASLSRIENHTQSPSLGLMRRIVTATGGEVQPSDFFSERGPSGQEAA